MLLRFRHIRKYLILAALPAALLLLHSCCRHNKIGVEEKRTISMNVSATGTKAIVEDLTGMINQCFDGDNRISNAGFGVYGFKKQVDNTSILLFDDRLVYPNTKTGTTWSYANTRYWDSNPVVSYQFIAYWPYLTNDPDELVNQTDPYVSVPDPVNGNYSSKVLTIHSVPNWQPVDDVNGTEKDFMTAVASGKYRSTVPDEVTAFRTGTVTFSFRHILSQVRIEAYSVGTSAPVYIKSVTLNESSVDANDVLSNASGASTDFTLGYDGSYATPYNPSLTSSTTLISNANILVQYVDELQENPTTVYTEVGHWLVVPHQWQNLILTVNRQIGDAGTPEDRDVTISLGTSPDYQIVAGNKYVITLMFDTSSGGLQVASVAVKDWDDEVEENREVYNW